MTQSTPQPPRIAMALLEWASLGNDALIGDVVEEFSYRQSRVWFWRQTLAAVATRGRRTREIRPLHLVDHPSTDYSSVARLSHVVRLSAVPAGNVGGLGMAALIVLMASVAPAAWWIVFIGVAGGVAAGIARISATRHRMLSSDAADVASPILGLHD